MEKTVIGIDLGTTNSLAAYWADGEVHLIPDMDGEVLTPSVVSYVKGQTGGFLVGKEAKKEGAGENTAASFKRFMGTEKEFFLGDTTVRALQLSAMVLRKIKEDAENFLGKEIEEAVITVPAYFNDRQRSDTKKAAQAAGLSVKRLINEPSAAALAYRYRYGEEDKSLLVFDFGGGTLDISLVECFEDVVEIIAVAGDNHLGGDDIDSAIVSYFCKQNHLRWETLGMEQQRVLRSRAEVCKLAQSRGENAELVLEIEGEAYRMLLTEDVLFEICLHLFAKIKTLFLRILKDSDYHISEIDDLIMVGGSSKLPIVKRFLTELLGKEPVVLGDTDRVVAMGAGIYAGIRQRNEDIRDFVLTDVCPFTLGLASSHDRKEERSYLLPVIERNSTLPAVHHKKLCTLSDYQNTILLKIYQGEEYFAEDNLFLGELEMPVPPKPAGEASIEVWFTYDLNGILQVEVSNERGERKRIFLANQELSEAEQRQCMAQLEKMLPDREEKERIAALQKRLQKLYEQESGRRRERAEAWLIWFLQGIQSGRRIYKRKVILETERRIELWEQEEEDMEDILFDGELKAEEDDWQDEIGFENQDGIAEVPVDGQEGENE